ncbi:(d)CMP kinase, partial [Alphaproteobacteria bacterium]|nr:(d)CMP kinase [Alphaproteobacteria bacterium]
QLPPDGAKGVILDGRDIGTIVCPDADTKIFVDASVETRANRRVKELRKRGVAAIYARVLQDMKDRDTRDRLRNVAPLVSAHDAYSLDTTNLDADAVFQEALGFIASRNMSGA